MKIARIPIWCISLALLCLLLLLNCHPTGKDADKASALCKLIRAKVKSNAGDGAANQIFYSLRSGGRVVIVVKTDLASVDEVNKLAQLLKEEVGVKSVETVHGKTSGK